MLNAFIETEVYFIFRKIDYYLTLIHYFVATLLFGCWLDNFWVSHDGLVFMKFFSNLPFFQVQEEKEIRFLLCDGDCLLEVPYEGGILDNLAACYRNIQR